jgi:lipopolysaccharide export system permease protein
MSVLGRYLSRMFLIRLAVVLFSVAGFGLLFDLLENADSVLRAAAGRQWPVLTYSLLRLPIIISEMITLSALVAGILTVGDLLRHRELVVMWNGGVSPLGVIVRLLPVGLLLVGLKFVIDDFLVPHTSGELRSWAVGEYKRAAGVAGVSEAIWLTSGQDIVRIPRSAAAKRQIDAITVFRRDQQGLLLERLDAKRAVPLPKGWELRDVTRRAVGSGREQQLDRVDWQGRIELGDIALLAREPRELSLSQLRTVIANRAFAIRSTDAYVTWFHVRLANAIVPFLLVVLAFGLARRFSRTGTLAPVFIRGIAIGFGFHICEGIVVALGEVGLVNPLLAAWALPLGLALVVLGPPIVTELRLGGLQTRPA